MLNVEEYEKNDAETSIDNFEKYRLDKAYNLATKGIIATVILTLAVLLMEYIFRYFNNTEYIKSESLVSLISPFLTLIGTLVGTFFGVQIGSAGKEKLSEEAKNANQKAIAFAAAANPSELQRAYDTLQNLSKKVTR
ncbi:hypothetical protein [Geobacter sp.]|uniref:hypothetical protein n=1 Tax=Geobacter sp. TaxID=46610 RepID=UPI001ACD4C4A|nr:hypothetical protein [Geobacter sp.]CAG1014917.1 hypothetical protein ANAEL_05118 [Anaerolineales bacterium]